MQGWTTAWVLTSIIFLSCCSVYVYVVCSILHSAFICFSSWKCIDFRRAQKWGGERTKVRVRRGEMSANGKRKKEEGEALRREALGNWKGKERKDDMGEQTRREAWPASRGSKCLFTSWVGCRLRKASGNSRQLSNMLAFFCLSVKWKFLKTKRKKKAFLFCRYISRNGSTTWNEEKKAIEGISEVNRRIIQINKKGRIQWWRVWF